MSSKIPLSVSSYMAQIGAKGGSAGRGKKKKRSPEHYRKMIEKRAAKRKLAAAPSEGET